ncbi:MAG: ribose-phosphate pyrophosphokinase [bacterium]|nr:ribose-phosphate pyrophosphokinase [bacterium]
MTTNFYPIKVFSGRSHRQFALDVCKYLPVSLGDCLIENFKDNEIKVSYRENIRGCDVFIIQPTQAPAENLLELLLMIDAAKRASAARVTAVIPYFGYARQDRKDQPRVSISARLVADLISTAGADRVLTMDLHASQIQGFFNIPVDHLYASKVFVSFLLTQNYPDLCIVSPDVGNIKIASAYAKRLNAELAIIDKRRTGPDEAKAMNILGEVNNRNILLVDDIVDTAKTLATATELLKQKGARSIRIAAVHPVLSEGAINRLDEVGIHEMFVSDSLPIKENVPGWLKVVSVAELFADAIKRIHLNESISTLFL